MAFKTPVSVLVVVHTTDLQILLLERALHPGFWQSVTGSLETGETPMATAIREVEEETGLDARQFPLTEWNLSNRFEIFPEWRHRYAPGVTHNVEHVFSLRVPPTVAPRIAAEEHRAWRWSPWQEAAEAVFSWTNRDAIVSLALDTSALRRSTVEPLG